MTGSQDMSPTLTSVGTTLTHFTADASAALGGPRWLARRRAEAFGRFAGTALPTESEEIWRYSGIDSFDFDAFAPMPAEMLGHVETGAVSSDLAAGEALARVLGPRSALVVTRDGAVRAVRKEPDLPEGAIEVGSARMGEDDGEEPLGLGELGYPRDAFGELHEAFLTDVVLVTVMPKALIAGPVVVVHLVGPAGAAGSSASGEAPSCFPRTLVRIGRSATAGVIELLVSAGSSALVVPVTELDVAEDARLDYANLQVLDQRSTQLALQASRVDRDGTLRSFTGALGGRYARVRTDSDVAGQGARSSLLAGYLGTDDQVHDFRTLQDHHGPRTRSELLFTGAVADRARSVYSGLIRIERGAHGADAFQTNHNLVLSEGAHADSVPNLDIDENDVRCSHASTVGPIDEEQRYYLESRGIEPSVAERLIVLGFFSDLAARAPFDGVGRFLEDAVRQRLAGRLPADRPSDATPGSADG
jgi:Fe-S cluster assembly protein SufD